MELIFAIVIVCVIMAGAILSAQRSGDKYDRLKRAATDLYAAQFVNISSVQRASLWENLRVQSGATKPPTKV